MATRTRKQTIPETPFVETIAPESVAPESFTMPKIDWAYLIKGEASWKRWACAVVASLATSYVVGSAGGYLVGILTFGAAVLTNSMFITMLVYALGFLLTMYAAYRASTFAYLKVIDKTVDDKCIGAWNWTKNLFGIVAPSTQGA